jgi:hypothetical protein
MQVTGLAKASLARNLDLIGLAAQCEGIVDAWGFPEFPDHLILFDRGVTRDSQRCEMKAQSPAAIQPFQRIHSDLDSADSLPAALVAAATFKKSI